jgi:undecaprenyl-diphosphatase
MGASRAARLFQRVDAVEQRLCVSLNRGCQRRAVRDLFRLVSRLGDGVFWYALILLVPVFYGERGVRPAIQMAVVSITGVVIYKLLKKRLVRERPYITHTGILAGSVPLDRYSFPSGHTLHAVSITILAMTHFPQLGWFLIPFAGLIACSRVVLGLHYPSDVLAGGALGATLAALGLLLIPT